MGDTDRAIEDYTRAIQINPIYALAYLNRAYAHEAKAAKAEAIEDFINALMLDKSLVGAAEGLKRLKATTVLSARIEAHIREGRQLVEQNCSRCHAVGTNGVSPNPKAPEFRDLQRRHPVLELREPITYGILAPHDEMPRFPLSPTEIEKIIAYINSLNTSPPKQRL
jgi:cytochrome c